MCNIIFTTSIIHVSRRSFKYISRRGIAWRKLYHTAKGHSGPKVVKRDEKPRNKAIPQEDRVDNTIRWHVPYNSSSRWQAELLEDHPNNLALRLTPCSRANNIHSFNDDRNHVLSWSRFYDPSSHAPNHHLHTYIYHWTIDSKTMASDLTWIIVYKWPWHHERNRK